MGRMGGLVWIGWVGVGLAGQGSVDRPNSCPVTPFLFVIFGLVFQSFLPSDLNFHCKCMAAGVPNPFMSLQSKGLNCVCDTRPIRVTDMTNRTNVLTSTKIRDAQVRRSRRHTSADWNHHAYCGIIPGYRNCMIW